MTASSPVWSFRQRLLFCIFGAACAHFLGGCGGSSSKPTSRMVQFHVEYTGTNDFRLLQMPFDGVRHNVSEIPQLLPSISSEDRIEFIESASPSIQDNWVVTPQPDGKLMIVLTDRSTALLEPHETVVTPIMMWRSGDHVSYSICDTTHGSANLSPSGISAPFASDLALQRPDMSIERNAAIAETVGAVASRFFSQ